VLLAGYCQASTLSGSYTTDSIYLVDGYLNIHLVFRPHISTGSLKRPALPLLAKSGRSVAGRDRYLFVNNY
jgi:hypothetical protein